MDAAFALASANLAALAAVFAVAKPSFELLADRAAALAALDEPAEMMRLAVDAMAENTEKTCALIRFPQVFLSVAAPMPHLTQPLGTGALVVLQIQHVRALKPGLHFW